MSRPRKTKTTTTKPEPVAIQSRDPHPVNRTPRRYIPANGPTVCPTCGHNTRMDDGRHVDPVRRTVLEYRTCIKCAAMLAAGRPMTKTECEKFCSRADAVAEYEQTLQTR